MVPAESDPDRASRRPAPRHSRHRRRAIRPATHPPAPGRDRGRGRPGRLGALPVRLHDGSPGGDRARHARRPRPRPSSRSGTPTTRSTSGTPAARSIATSADPGRDPGDDRRARRPVLHVPHVRGVPPEPAGDQRPVRGDRRRDRDPGDRRDARVARRSGRTATCSSPARWRARRPSAPASVAGDLVLEADGASLDGLTVDGARDRIRGPKGTVVILTDPARQR